MRHVSSILRSVFGFFCFSLLLLLVLSFEITTKFKPLLIHMGFNPFAIIESKPYRMRRHYHHTILLDDAAVFFCSRFCSFSYRHLFLFVFGSFFLFCVHLFHLCAVEHRCISLICCAFYVVRQFIIIICTLYIVCACFRLWLSRIHLFREKQSKKKQVKPNNNFLFLKAI